MLNCSGKSRHIRTGPNNKLDTWYDRVYKKRSIFPTNEHSSTKNAESVIILSSCHKNIRNIPDYTEVFKSEIGPK